MNWSAISPGVPESLLNSGYFPLKAGERAKIFAILPANSIPEITGMSYFIFDGQMADKKEVLLSEEFTDSRLRILQKMWYGYGGIPLFEENLYLLKIQSEHLNIPVPEIFENSRELFRLVKRMLNKNKLYRSGHVMIQILAGGNSATSLITSTGFPGFTFPFSEEGLLVNFSSQRKHSGNTFNKLPFFNERIWQSALAQLKGTPYQQSIILNEQGFVCECAFAGLFMVAGNELIYPSVQSGCHINSLLPFVLEATKKTGLRVTERAFISQEGLLNADELFIVSEDSGMQWLLGIENQRFIHYYSQKINEELNLLLKRKAASSLLS